jgi:putative CocE/NonD family hydrolase
MLLDVNIFILLNGIMFMYNWLLIILGIAGMGFELIFDFRTFLFVSLPIMVVCRFIYVIAFYFRYLRPNGRDLVDDTDYPNSNREVRFFIAKNIILVIFGSILIYGSIYIGLYSVLVAGIYFRKCAEEENDEKWRIIFTISGFILKLSPLVFIVLILLLGSDLAQFIALVVGLFVYLSFGHRWGDLSAVEISKKAKRRYFRDVSKSSRNIIVFCMIIFPSFIVIGSAWYSTPLEFTKMVEMEDGTKLKTNIYLSPLIGNNPAPVIICRTPYGIGSVMDDLYASIYGSKGYHFVCQDMRGCHGSEGGNDFLMFTKSYTDGNETIEWIREQTWGKDMPIASVGISAMCINQYYYAGMEPEGLMAQSLWFGTPDLISDAIVEGAFHDSLVNFWLESTAPDNYRQQISYIFDIMSDLTKLDCDAAHSVSLNTSSTNVNNTYERVNVRALHVGGWYDHFLRGTLRGYIGYDDRGQERARGHQKMIIGPWIHGMVFLPNQGELVYPTSSVGLPKILEWEDEILCESLEGIDDPSIWEGNRVAYYLMGDVDDPNVDANKWKYAEDWPLDYTEEPWYMIKSDSGYKLQKSTTGVSATNLSYLYDPRYPVTTRGGNNEPNFDSAGPMDQVPVEINGTSGELREDILLFESDAITSPLTFEGNLRAKLNVKSSCNDTTFVVKLCDVYPDGRRMLIIDSALQLRYRDGITSEAPMINNTEFAINIDMAATAYQFNIGHKIAVVVTSSNYDRYSINPNTGGPIYDHYGEGIIANNTLITGPGKSCIYLPILNS